MELPTITGLDGGTASSSNSSNQTPGPGEDVDVDKDVDEDALITNRSRVRTATMGTHDNEEDFEEVPSVLKMASGSPERAQAVSNEIQAASCLVDGCQVDLSGCKEYHRRHNVCETHFRTPEVEIRGHKQRFCQQCSRFHSLEEFDEGNRSCKKCLDGHNRRRREPQSEPLSHPRPTISHHFSILHVLDLSNTEIKSLPQSISRLVALQKLYLRNCECLMELPPEIGELTNLEVLDLEGTEILCLPKEVAKLVKLTCLRVSFYGYANQTVIPRKVLPNLSRLNELIIDVTPYGEWWDVEVEAIIDDLHSLKELRALKLGLPTAKQLEELTLIFPSLAIFRFTLGRCEDHFISRVPRDVEEEFNNWEKLEKGLKYVNGDRIPNEITKLFKHVNAFFLQCHWTANSLSEFGHENLNEVKFCLVMECNEFRTIIDSEQFYQGSDGRAESEDFQDFDEAIVLGSLERLIVRYMKNMESIWKGPVEKGSMSSLKCLALHTCPNLTTLFTIDMLSNLINLEELLVEDCPKIKSLVSLKNSCSKSGPFLPNLKKISLLELPRLVSISSGLCIALKLERMVIFYCPKLEKLSSMDISSTNLKVIKGEEEWWYALKWYESDVSTEHEDYLTSLFIPLRTDGDLFAQLTEDYIAAYDQGKFGSYK